MSDRSDFKKQITGDYPNNWYELRRQAYQRDDYQCRNCQIQGGQKGDIELHAHHIVPISDGGNNVLSNLATLCIDCHALIHDHIETDEKIEPEDVLETDNENIQTGGHKNEKTVASDTKHEFTGTVVQTGDPVILDDGTETVSVETGERFHLGEEVTVRGSLQGDRLDADDVF